VQTRAYPAVVTPPLAAHHRTTPYHHGDLAEALVGEALERVRTDGADKVSLRAVAQAVGVSASAAYHHFPDKDALLHEVGHRGAGLLDERVDRAVRAVEGDGDGALVRRMRAIGRAYVEFAVDEPNLFRHTFGPLCAHDAKGEAAPGEGGRDPDHVYAVLCRTLDAMDAAGLLRRREGADLLAWTVVHGLSGLLIDGLVPLEARDVVLGSVLVNLLAEPSRLPELLGE
jgi:AcrR family transcriptional regulator